MKEEFHNNIDDDAGKWYTAFEKTEVPFQHNLSDIKTLEWKDKAKKYFDAETSAFQLKESKSYNSETAWLKTALSQGTSSDKIAASVILIQNNPKYNLARLISLVSQVKTAKHNQSGTLVSTLKDLFLQDLLHPKFKLMKFEEQDLSRLENSNDETKFELNKNKLLAHWYFEDQLREQYERFVLSLANIANDTVDTNREKAIAIMTDLLIGNAEQEHKLLELIVNKIGDPNSKVASKAVFCLNKLLQTHPNMKSVVLKEVEKLIFRSNVAVRAQYYAICLLTQIILDKSDENLAANLLDLYLAFFKACLKKGEPDGRMMAAILTGVNRAYPFAKVESTKLNAHIDSIFKVVHVGSFNVSLNAFNLLYQVIGKDETQANRFYIAFYRKLLDPQIGVANKRAIFLNLLYKVLQKDPSVARLCAFIKRVLQIALYFPPNMSCATLYIVSKILQNRKDLRKVYLYSEPIVKKENFNSSERPILLDLEQEEEEIKSKEESNVLINIMAEPASENMDLKSEYDIKDEFDKEKSYDPFGRNPLYARAIKTSKMELSALSMHFHPSVALFAKNIIQDKPIDYTGDPLEDLNLIRFLDRYVFKNPKKLEDKKTKSRDPLAQRAGYTPKGIRSLPVNSAVYLNEREDRIPVDELFLYQYLKKKRNESENMIDKQNDDDDNESVNSEEFNEMLDNLSGNKDLESLDIAAGIVPGKKRKETSSDHDSSSDEGDADDSEDDLDLEGEGQHSDEEDLQDFSDLDDIDDDLSEMDFNEDSENEFETNKHGSNKRKNRPKQNSKNSNADIFVSAEKFAEMLAEQGRRKGKHGGTNEFSNLDKASAKQIDWEARRAQKLQGIPKNKKKPINKTWKNKNYKKRKIT